MKTLKQPIIGLLSALFLFSSSCNGQPQEQLSYTSKNSRLRKTQGTDKYQNIHCSLQDRDGHLWFGTTGEGVYRYDGKVFTQFTEKDGLSNNKVWSILEDKSGRIWFGTDDGLSCYNGKSISPPPIATNMVIGLGASLNQADQNAVWSLMQDKNGIIWLGTSKDLYCYDGKSFSRFLDKHHQLNHQHLKLNWIQCLLEDKQGRIWMGSGPIAEEGVICFDGKSVSASKPTDDGWIRHIIEDNNGVIWFSGRNKGLFRYDGKGYHRFIEKEDIGSAILKDKNGNIWFDGGEKLNSTESASGLWRYDGKTFKNFSIKNGMGQLSVWSILEDKRGDIWVGTRNCELYRYNGQAFSSFTE